MNDTMVPRPPSGSPFNGSGRGAAASEVTEQQPQNVILPMRDASVRRIVAGQAITDLSSAIKELIDNALDAGSNTINIRLFNQGLDIVEVTDNGCGVPVESRPYMAMKHATSKIRDFDDICNVDSLGFRGEALFCLANISNKLVVATQTADERMGQKLEFTRDGYLRGDTVCPVSRGKVGTTVAVVKLFDALPVRRADLEKRITAQRREAFLMVQGYAIHCLGIKFNLFDIGPSGEEQLRLSTMLGTVKLEQTISSVIGSSFLSGMSRIVVDLPIDGSGTEWKVEGLVSKAPTLTGRQGAVARNAQFFCINGRPVDLPRISKALSEAWRTLEGATRKKPACVLRFTLPKNSFDVNLSPNKRHVLLTHEKQICELVYAGVLEFWSNQRDGKFVKNEFDGDNVEAADFDGDGRNPAMPQTPDGTRRFKRRLAFVNDFQSVKLQHHAENDALQGSSSHSTSSRLSPPPQSVTPSKPRPEELLSASKNLFQTTDAERRRFAAVQEKFHKQHREQQEEIMAMEPITPEDDAARKDDKAKSLLVSLQSFAHQPQAKNAREDGQNDDLNEAKRKVMSLQDFGFQPLEKISKTSGSHQAMSRRASSMTPQAAPPARKPLRRENPYPVLEGRKRRSIEVERKSTDAAQEIEEQKNEEEGEKPEAVRWDSFESTEAVVRASREARLESRNRRKRLKELSMERQQHPPSSQDNGDGVIAETTGDSKPIVTLTKKDFEEMEVIGQFNLGFILAKCKKNNLWVLDQHACDEKYNFERLCANTVMHEQKLLAPMPLELSPAEESCILDNLDVFEKNGFRIQHDPEKPPRHRLSLTSLPHSGARDGRKAVQFGKDDVRALCAVLGSDGTAFDGGTGVDGSGMYGNNAVRRYAGSSQNGEQAVTRLPKAVAMFANRACRGSVMIGTALSKKEMEAIVQRLASVEHPWNCPHGRPTLKHLCDMLGPESKDERRTLEQTVGPTVVAMPDLTQPDE